MKPLNAIGGVTSYHAATSHGHPINLFSYTFTTHLFTYTHIHYIYYFSTFIGIYINMKDAYYDVGKKALSNDGKKSSPHLARPGKSRSPGGRTNFNAMSGSLAPPTKTFTPRLSG